MFIIEINGKYYARGYTNLNIVLVSNKAMARKFFTNKQAERFGKRLFKKEFNVIPY